MPNVTPCAHPVNRQAYGPGISPTQRAFGRHFGTIYEASTLLRVGGVWQQKNTPTQTLMASADIVLQGGHVYAVSNALVDEIEAAGFCVSVVIIPSEVTYPSSSTYPGGTYPGSGTTDIEAPEEPGIPVASFLPGDGYLPSDSQYPGDP